MTRRLEMIASSRGLRPRLWVWAAGERVGQALQFLAAPPSRSQDVHALYGRVHDLFARSQSDGGGFLRYPDA